MKLCKDCKWIKRVWFVPLEYSKCICPAPERSVEKVTGDYSIKHCQNQREFNFTFTCGAEGKWWEPKK